MTSYFHNGAKFFFLILSTLARYKAELKNVFLFRRDNSKLCKRFLQIFFHFLQFVMTA